MISKRSITLFKRAAKELPAYRAFLEASGCNMSLVNSPDTFIEYVPLTDKKQYLMRYALKDLVWKPDLEGLLLFCATSGSTGEPYYFPRNEKLSWQYANVIEDYVKHSSYGRGHTLVIIGFGMGVWIGGVITLRAFEIASQRLNVPIAILPTGYNKIEIFKALKRLAPEFSQTIIVGYPPFVKELVDEAKGEGIDLPKMKVRFLFAAEAFTETFRDYICKAAGISNPLRDTLNIYGTADIGAMAYETPLSIFVRRLVFGASPFLRKELFKQIEKTPTLAQYNPEFIEFEEVRGEVVLTGDSAMPLIRYAVGDHGGVFSFSDIDERCRRYNIDLNEEIEKAGIGAIINKELPFVYVYERKDLAATLQGIIIYPEFIKESLMGNPISSSFTGRFTMSTKYDIRHNQFLQINLELQRGIKQSTTLREQALMNVHESLIARSSEFAEVAKSRASDKLLQIVLWPSGHHRYFAPGTKQKWVEEKQA